MEIRPLAVPGIFELLPAKYADERGFFSETFSQQGLAKAGIVMNCVQENHSYSATAGVVRGLHFQAPPAAQDKLVRCVRGKVFDVAVDIRHGSPHFGRWAATVLSAKAWNQVFVPKGFAHGFAVLEPDTEILYMVSAPYSRDHERSIRYDDPSLAITWPLEGLTPVLSEKDRAAPALSEIDTGFRWTGGGA